MRSTYRRPVLGVVLLTCILSSTASVGGCDVDWDAAMTEFRTTAVPSMFTAMSSLIDAFLDGLSAVLTPNSSSSGSS